MIESFLNFVNTANTYGIPQPEKLDYDQIVMGNLGLVGGVEEGELILGNGFHEGPSDLAMKRKYTWLLTGAMGIVTASLCLAENVLRDKPEVVVLAGIATILGGIAASYFSFGLVDLNSASERRQLVQEISMEPFHKIAETYSSVEVNKFCLFNNDEPYEPRINLYKKFEQLYEQYISATQNRDRCFERVNELYRVNGGHLERQLTWTETRKDKDGKEEMITHYPDTTPTNKKWFLMSNPSPAQARLTEWVDWKQSEYETINATCDAHFQTLDAAFEEQKAELLRH